MIMLGRCLISVFMLSSGSLCADGIFAYKNQYFHNDKDAHLILYSEVDPGGPVTWVVSGGKRIGFETSQPHEWIELPTRLPANLVLPHETTSVSEKIREIQRFVEKYPKSAKACESVLQLQVSAEDKIKSGQVRYQSEWMTRENYREIVAERKREDELAQAVLVKAREDRIKLEEVIKSKELASKDAVRFGRVQAIEAEIQGVEAENKLLKSIIRDRFSEISKIIIENHL